MQRRNFLATSAILVAQRGGWIEAQESLNNQLGTGGFPSYDMPRYSDWVPADSRGESGVIFTHIDWETLDAIEDDEEEEESEGGEEEIAEIGEEIPILGLPFYGAVITFFTIFGIFSYPFTGDLLPGDEEERVEGVETSSMTWIENLLVFHGTYDSGVFTERYADDFEAVEERAGFTVYVGATDFTEGMAYAVSEDTLVVGMHPGEDEEYVPEEVVSEALDRKVGDLNRVVDTDDGRWLFETTGEAPMSFGVWETNDLRAALGTDEDGGEDRDEEQNESNGTDLADPDLEENPVFDGVESLINNLAFTVDDGEISEMETRFSGLYPEDAVPTEEEVREYLIGHQDIPHDIIIDGSRVHATAQFEEDPQGPTSRWDLLPPNSAL